MQSVFLDTGLDKRASGHQTPIRAGTDRAPTSSEPDIVHSSNMRGHIAIAADVVAIVLDTKSSSKGRLSQGRVKRNHQKHATMVTDSIMSKSVPGSRSSSKKSKTLDHVLAKSSVESNASMSCATRWQSVFKSRDINVGPKYSLP